MRVDREKQWIEGWFVEVKIIEHTHVIEHVIGVTPSQVLALSLSHMLKTRLLHVPTTLALRNFLGVIPTDFRISPTSIFREQADDFLALVLVGGESLWRGRLILFFIFFVELCNGAD